MTSYTNTVGSQRHYVPRTREPIRAITSEQTFMAHSTPPARQAVETVKTDLLSQMQ